MDIVQGSICVKRQFLDKRHYNLVISVYGLVRLIHNLPSKLFGEDQES